ncbi:MAG: glycine cleavage system protein GcvH [Nitrospirae bacterium]|nr:glycine cleavage system protein GcvH [Nitrospirota bacterium]MBI5694610.1 glycine cleavage system protein GcvH [Nitrospirota bacterium]
MNPENLKYHKEHSWVKVDGNRATIGITEYAQESLGDIVYMDLPEADSQVEADGEIGEIESTKATSSVVSPVTGTIVKVNEELEDAPETINEDPYGKGWIVVVEMDDASELGGLMDAEEYGKFVEESK